MGDSESAQLPTLCAESTLAERRGLLLKLLRHAVRAPSPYNNQPWRFVVRGDRVLVYADRSRHLPSTDPRQRLLTMSCGAAALFLQLAMRHAGYTGEVEALPVSENPELLAVVSLGGPYVLTADDKRLFDALPKRRTQHGAFRTQAVPPQLIESMRVASALEGAAFLPVAAGVRERVADLVADGYERRAADRRFSRELARWVYRGDSNRSDGIPAGSFGEDGAMTRVLSRLQTRAAQARRQAGRMRELTLSAPLLVVLSTESDEPADWLAAGMALGRLLLEAAAEGVYAGYASHLIEEPNLRAPLQRLVEGAACPQLVLRLGYAEPQPVTRRRPVEDVATVYAE